MLVPQVTTISLRNNEVQIFACTFLVIHLLCRELNCGNHRCELTCHPPPCLPCHLLPSHTTTCPCGAMPLSALLSSDQARTSCLDPIPTCSRTCGKLLPCSTKGVCRFSLFSVCVYILKFGGKVKNGSCCLLHLLFLLIRSLLSSFSYWSV